MIELRGKAVADAHKAILQEKVAAVGDSVITMAVLLVGEDHGAHMYATFMEKTAKNFGYGFVLKQLPETATQDEVVTACLLYTSLLALVSTMLTLTLGSLKV